MGAELTDWQAAIASALDWWHDAGVTSLAAEVPRDWLRRAREAPPPAADAPPPAVIGPVAAVPTDLAAFNAWRCGPDAPEASWPGTALFASGPLDAPLLVLVDCPDRDDEAEGHVLGGASGRLFDRMLAAIGESRETIALAPIMTKRPFGRPPGPVLDQLHMLARRYVALARPRRLLLLGDAASRAFTGTEAIAARGSLHPINHDGGTVTAVASLHPRLLRDHPAEKAKAWKDLQLLMGAPEA